MRFRFVHVTNGVDFSVVRNVCLCFTSHRQRGHLQMAPPFTVHCKGCEARSMKRY